MTQPPTDALSKAATRLTDIVRALRDPSSGCPWDQEQDHASMRTHLVEEAYEVIDAIDDADDGALRSELGDLLFQIVFHAQLAVERGAFDLADVFTAISDKMIARHPHVFGDGAKLTSSQEVLQAWERRKQTSGRGVLDGVPRHLPALQRARRLTTKAATVGFDWPDTPSVMDKLDEELGELREAMASGDSDAIEDELGDTLFALANLARHLDIEPEAALRRTLAKFERRFAHIEAVLAAQGRHPNDASLEDMDAIWNEAKTQE